MSAFSSIRGLGSAPRLPWPAPQAPSARPAFATVAATMHFIASGCGVSFPDESRIEDLRVLEIRADPPEIAVFEPGQRATSSRDLLALRRSATTVRLTALVAHPDRDAALSYDWYRCTPGFQSLPCEGDARSRLVTSTASAIDISPISILFEEVAQAPDDALGSLNRIVQDPRDLLNGISAFINARVTVDRAAIEVDTRALDALKRVVIFDPVIVRLAMIEADRLIQGQAVPMVEGFNLPNLCTTLTPEQRARIFDFLDRRTPNRAPEYESVEFARRRGVVETATRALDAGEILELSADEQLVLRGRAREGDREEYQIIDDNCELIVLRETLAWSWFTDRGSLSSSLTVEGSGPADFQDSHTVYRPPFAGGDIEGATRARIYSVLRDGRGGSASRVVEVKIVK